MIDTEAFIKLFQENDIEFFTGVPDSLLKDVCAYISDNLPVENHVIASNEGAAVGLAVGYHLGTGGIPVVYMQNSGLGNAVNPLMSIADREVYNIPMIMLVGWRGEPGVKDEPQHVKQGKVTLKLLEAMNIRYAVVDRDIAVFKTQLSEALEYIKESNEPYAFVIRTDTFESCQKRECCPESLEMTREKAIELVVSYLDDTDIVVSTTGMISRELFECRESNGTGHDRDFLTVGAMGHASQIALGIAKTNPSRDVFCFDGDGAMLMHMGALAIIGSAGVDNYYHVIFNNGAHDSVGGQPTVGLLIDIPNIALSCGYRTAISVDNEQALKNTLQGIKLQNKPLLLEIKVCRGARKDLGRPATTPVENKKALMEFIKHKR